MKDERFILSEIPITATFEKALETLNLSEPEDIELMEGLFAKAKEIARPKVLFEVAYIDNVDISRNEVVIGDTVFCSPTASMLLKDIGRVFAYIATCGAEVDEWSHSQTDYVVSVWLDMIKALFLYDAINFFKNHLKTIYGLEKISFVNPGAGNLENWPIREQKKLFGLLGDVKGDIGVILTDSFLMLPTKTVSGLAFPTEKEFHNCDLCNRKNCPGRHNSKRQE